MHELAYAIGAILVGFVGLVWSADRFVDGSAAMARNLGVSPLVIGLTVVSLGTSAPEILVSVSAALAGAGSMAIGNALGSNLANIGLVLGVTALVARLPVQKHLLQHEVPVLLTVTAAAGTVLWDLQLTRVESTILLLMIAPVLVFFVLIKKRTQGPLPADEEIPRMPQLRALVLFLTGLILLIASSRVLVWGATGTAGYFGVSPLLIGMTVVAVGTSLPELAASIASALRGHHDIALGNVVGSNIFNLLAVMSVPALIQPLTLEPQAFNRDYLFVAGLTLLLAALLILNYSRQKDKSKAGIGRAIGGILLLCYCLYYVLLFESA